MASLFFSCNGPQEKIYTFEEKLDSAEAYGRKDSIIVSGAVPPVLEGENTKQVAINLLKSKFSGIEISPSDVSISHRLQPRFSNGQSAKPPNIYMKLCRRDQKQLLIQASKNQPKDGTNKIFINSSLTKQRSAVLQTLLKIKKDHAVIRGVTSMEGSVYVYTPSPPSASRDARRPKDIRHLVNTRRALQKFCTDFIRKPLEDFVANWPTN